MFRPPKYSLALSISSVCNIKFASAYVVVVPSPCYVSRLGRICFDCNGGRIDASSKAGRGSTRRGGRPSTAGLTWQNSLTSGENNHEEENAVREMMPGFARRPSSVLIGQDVKEIQTQGTLVQIV